MKRLLLIVDPQIDFINGTLPVPGAAEAMDSLAEYISQSDGRYAHKIVTADRHPLDHCSFKASGGIWPPHCIHDTAGAAVWQPLFTPLYLTEGDVTFLHKGQKKDTEEYSIFRNRDAAGIITGLVSEMQIDRIDLCGIAGDVCVNDTLKDGVSLFGNEMFNILMRFCPSIDGGTGLTATMKKLGVKGEM